MSDISDKEYEQGSLQGSDEDLNDEIDEVNRPQFDEDDDAQPDGPDTIQELGSSADDGDGDHYQRRYVNSPSIPLFSDQSNTQLNFEEEESKQHTMLNDEEAVLKTNELLKWCHLPTQFDNISDVKENSSSICVAVLERILQRRIDGIIRDPRVPEDYIHNSSVFLQALSNGFYNTDFSLQINPRDLSRGESHTLSHILLVLDNLLRVSAHFQSFPNTTRQSDQTMPKVLSSDATGGTLNTITDTASAATIGMSNGLNSQPLMSDETGNDGMMAEQRKTTNLNDDEEEKEDREQDGGEPENNQGNNEALEPRNGEEERQLVLLSDSMSMSTPHTSAASSMPHKMRPLSSDCLTSDKENSLSTDDRQRRWLSGQRTGSSARSGNSKCIRNPHARRRLIQASPNMAISLSETSNCYSQNKRGSLSNPKRRNRHGKHTPGSSSNSTSSTVQSSSQRRMKSLGNGGRGGGGSHSARLKMPNHTDLYKKILRPDWQRNSERKGGKWSESKAGTSFRNREEERLIRQLERQNKEKLRSELRWLEELHSTIQREVQSRQLTQYTQEQMAIQRIFTDAKKLEKEYLRSYYREYKSRFDELAKELKAKTDGIQSFFRDQYQMLSEERWAREQHNRFRNFYEKSELSALKQEIRDKRNQELRHLSNLVKNMDVFSESDSRELKKIIREMATRSLANH